MLELKEFKTLSGISEASNPNIQKLTQAMEKPFVTFSSLVKQIFQSFSSTTIEKWEYVTDPASGLRVLKSEKDPEALDHVRQIADELFK